MADVNKEGPRTLSQVVSEGGKFAVEDREAPTYMGIRRTLSKSMDEAFSTYREKALAEQKAQAEPTPGFWGVASAALDSEWVAPAAERWWDRNVRGNQDEKFVMGPDVMKELVTQYNDNEMKYLAGSFSQDDLDSRKQDIKEDRDRSLVLDNAGVGGLGARIVAGVFDPTMIAAAILTGPAAVSQKAGRVANILRMGGVTAAESAATEALLLSGDTQRNWNDVAIAGISGGILGGAIGSFRRTSVAGKAEEAVVSTLDDVDATLSKAGRQMQVDEAIATHLNARAAGVDAAVLQDARDAYRMKVSVDASGPGLRTKQVKSLETKLQTSKSELKASKAESQKAINALWDELDTAINSGAKNANELLRYIDARVDKIEANQAARELHLSSKIQGAEERLAAGNKTAEAKARLKEWDSMTPEQQANHLYPDEAPMAKAYKEMKAKSARDADEAFIKSEAALAKKYKPEEPVDTEAKSVSAAAAVEPKGDIFDMGEHAKEDSWLGNAIDRLQAHEVGSEANFTKGIPSIMLSDYTNLMKAKNLDTRALVDTFLENPQSAASGKTVSALQWLNDKIIRKAQGASLDRGFDLYAKELGISRGRAYMSRNMREEYETKVAMAVKGLTPEEDLPESIKMARDGVARQLSQALRLRKDAGELGFEKVSENKNYFPDIMSTENFNRINLTAGWDEAQWKKLIAKGYQSGANELTDAQANLIAHIKYKNMVSSQLYDGDAKAVFNAKSAAEANTFLKAANVPQDLIDAFFTDVFTKEDWASVSKRARASLHIDWNAEHTYQGSTVRISDLMNTNVGQVVEAYTNEASFGAAMAEMGIKSEAMLSRVITQAKKSAMNEAAANEVSVADVKALFQRFENSLTLLRGKSLVDYYGRFATANKAGRVLLDATALLRLQQVGFSTIPELARVITSAGLSTVLSAVPGSGMFRNPFNRAAGREYKSLKSMNKEMEDIEELVGFIGEDSFNRTFSVRPDEEGSEIANRWAGYLDKGLEASKNISQYVSGHHLIQGGFEKIAARAVNRRLLKDALGSQKMNSALRGQLRAAGMSDQRWSDISDWVKANKGSQEFNWRKVNTWNLDAMPTDMKRDLQVSMARIFNKNIQKGFVGESNTSWMGPLGRFLTQFKSFPLMSLEKQLIADVRGDKVAAASTFLWGLGLAYVAYTSQMNLRAMGMEEGKRETYLDEALNPANLAWGVFNKHSQLASVGLVTDYAAMFGMMPAGLMDENRYGFQKSNITGIAPVLGVGKDVMSTADSLATLGGALTGVGEEDDVEAASKGFAKNLRKILPFTNTIVIGEGLKTISGLNED